MVDDARQAVLAVVGQTWARRWAIEMEASARFGALAVRLAQAGAPEVVVDLARNASQEEQRHAAHCDRYAAKYSTPKPSIHSGVVEYAPRHLSPPQRLLYEVVAQCCVAETQSTTTLVALLDAVEDAQLREVLHELARDEVNHGRLGWAFLAWARQSQDLGFLAPLLPSMIQGSAGPEMFAPPSPAADSPELFSHGVVPASTRRQLYVETLNEVIFPGFDQHGIDTRAVRSWLEGKQ